MEARKLLHENSLYSFFRFTAAGSGGEAAAAKKEKSTLGLLPRLSAHTAYRRLEEIFRLQEGTPAVFLPPLRIDRGIDGPCLIFDPGEDELLCEMICELHEEETLFLRVAAAISFALEEAHDAGIILGLMLPVFLTFNRNSGDARLIYTGYSYDPSQPEEISYIPPECTGRISCDPDHRLDLYSLGILLAAIRYGNDSALGSSGGESALLQEAYRALTSRKVKERNPVDAVIGKLLRVLPDERYRSAWGTGKDFEECLRFLRESSAAGGFEPGRHDHSPYLEIPTTLRGRDDELLRLSDGLEAARREGRSISFVTGYSGSGKTALIEEFINRNASEENPLLLLRSKCDQFVSTPFSSVRTAFENLAFHFLGAPEKELKIYAGRFAEITEPHSSMIAELVPAWKNLLPKAERRTIVAGPVERQNIVRRILTEILKTASEFANPTVFFVDDMQWIDPASLQLIMDIADSPGMSSFLLIGAYRSNEVDDTHPLSRRLEELERKNVPHNFIEVRPLGPAEIEEIVEETLRCPKAAGKPIAGMLLDKSGGNPFFMRVLFSSFYSDGLIKKAEDGSWSWNREKIDGTVYGDEAAEVLVQRVEMQPENLRELLRTAAYLGPTFSIRELSVIDRRNRTETEKLCDEAEAEGFIAKTEREREYRFTHDKIQRVFYLLEPTPDLSHYRIAVELRRHADMADPFTLASHYRMGKAFIDSKEERIWVSGLFLEAGKKALELTAWKDGYSYFAHALEFAGDDIWERDYPAALELYNLLCEGAFLSGEHGDFRGYFDQIVRRADSVLDTVTAKQLSLRVLMAENKMREAFETLLTYLPPFHIPDPRSFPSERLRREILRAMRRLTKTRGEELGRLPLSTDRWEIARQELLVSAFSTVYISAAEHVPFFAWQMVQTVERTGFNEISPFCLLCFTFPLIGLRRYREAYHIGTLGETLVRGKENHPYGSKVHTWFSGFLVSWNAPIEGMLEGCREGVAAGERSGDFEYASYSFALLTGCRLIYTMPLGEAHRLNEEYIQRTLEMKQDRNVSALRAHKMFLENLLGRSVSPLSMSTGELSEEDELKRARESRDLSYLGTVCVYRLMRDFIYGELDAAAVEIERGKEFIAALTGQVSVSTYYLFAALTLLRSGKPLSRGDRRLIRTSFMNFRTWARTAPANHEHRLLWLRAQRDASEGKTGRALKHFEAAARAALSRGFFGEAGSCYECAGDFILERRGKTAAAGFYVTALESYEKWEGWGKLELLRKKLAEVFPSFSGYSGVAERESLTSEETSTPQQEEPSPQPSFSSFFDRLSLLETSRIMTAEKKPETLLSGLLEIFVKSSGATLGYLFLADGTEHFPASVVVAKNRGGTLRTEQVATEENGEPPLSLALKVYRTGETLGLEADHRKEFFNDPYLRRENPKAFYCSPLRHKSSIAGVLFLEHDLHREFFSPDTVEILDILTSQAAVALENFTLYAQLLEKMRRERRLEEENRTHLENLMQAEKMATLGLLTSEIGHEINNMGHPLQLAAGQLEAIERDLTPLLYEIAGEQLWEGASLGGLPITEAGRRLSEIIATIKESSGQIVRLATQLRGYYKEKEQGSASADLNEIVSSTLILASHVINSSTDRFTFTPGDIPRINGNRRRLQQVFLNLIKNGCQSLESRHASLTVSTSPDESGRFVVAEVTDDGKGMEPETLAAAGNPFFTTKGTEEGTGLGLSIVRRIVEEHRAIMEIESEPGKGTTVRLRFPALEAEVRHD